MPNYEFQCTGCGLRFERVKSMARADEPQACVSCGTTAQRVISGANFTFAHDPVGGPRPQNTGVHSIDYNADRVIGRDAEQKWKVIEGRQAHKRAVIKDNPGSTGFDLSRTHDGGYRVMRPEERRASESARQIHKKALDSIEASRTKAGGG